MIKVKSVPRNNLLQKYTQFLRTLLLVCRAPDQPISKPVISSHLHKRKSLPHNKNFFVRKCEPGNFYQESIRYFISLSVCESRFLSIYIIYLFILFFWRFFLLLFVFLNYRNCYMFTQHSNKTRYMFRYFNKKNDVYKI